MGDLIPSNMLTVKAALGEIEERNQKLKRRAAFPIIVCASERRAAEAALRTRQAGWLTTKSGPQHRSQRSFQLREGGGLLDKLVLQDMSSWTETHELPKVLKEGRKRR